MLNAVDQHDLCVVVDLVDDPVIPAPSRPQSRQRANKRLADSARVLGKSAQHQRHGSVADFGRQLVKVSQAFGSDVDVVQASAVVAHPDAFASRRLLARSLNGRHELGVAQDLEGLLERLQIIGADEDERRPAVPGHEDAIVVLLDSVSQLGEVALGVGEGKGLGHWSRF